VSEPRSYREAARGAPRRGPVADLGHLSAFDVHPSHREAEAGDNCAWGAPLAIQRWPRGGGLNFLEFGARLAVESTSYPEEALGFSQVCPRIR